MRKKILAAFALVWLVFGLLAPVFAGSALAQEPTETYEPLFKTPTPQPPKDYTCGNGMPGGWGTVTPDPWWNINCSQCLLTQTPNGTPGTPEITQTPTPAPGGNFELYCYDTTDHQCNGQHGKDVSIFWNNHSNESAAWVGYRCEDGKTCTDTIVTIYWKVTGVHTAERWDVTRQWWHQQFGEGIWGNNYEQEHLECNETNYCQANNNWSGNFILQMFGGQTNVILKAGSKMSQWSYASYGGADGLLVSFSPLDQATPTPAPTQINSYCANLPGSGGGGGDDGMGALPVIRVGTGSCVTISAIDLDSADWPIIGEIIGDINFPGFQVCFKPVIFGTLAMFGLTVNLDTIAAVMAGVVAVRIMTRS